MCVMWQMKELLFKFLIQALWKRRKGLYYAVSVVSIAGNLVVFVGPSVQSSLVLRSGALLAAWSTLPQVAELVLQRSVLYLLLNLIVVRIVVKSGMLGRTMPGAPAKVEDSCLPSSSSYVDYVIRGLPWLATSNYSIYDTQTQTVPCSSPMFTDSSMWLQQARSENQNSAMVDVCAKTPVRKQQPIKQQTAIKKPRDEEAQPKCAPIPSLFTIEPLEDQDVQTTESHTLKGDQAHADDKTLKHPLRKVATRRADLHRSYTQPRAGRTTKGSRKAVDPPQQREEQCKDMELVLAKQDGEDGAAAEDEDNRLTRQEFNERVDTFISKFKRSLTMQRQDSFNRLLELVGGGGDIRLIK